MPNPQPIGTPQPEIHIKPDVSPPQARRRTSISHASTRTSIDAHSSIAMKPTMSIQTAMVSCFAMPILAVKPTVLVQSHCHQVSICQFGHIWCSGRWGPFRVGMLGKDAKKKEREKIERKKWYLTCDFSNLRICCLPCVLHWCKKGENWRYYNGRGARPQELGRQNT